MAMQSSLPQEGIKEMAITSVFLVLAIVAVIARFYARSLQGKSISLDDYLLVAGLFFTIATVGLGYAFVLNAGVGLHMVDATSEQMEIAMKLFMPACLTWGLATFFIKLSILFFYISIFTFPRLRTAVFIVITLDVALIIVVIFESFLLCRPLAYTWDKTIPGGVCGNSTESYLSVAILNLILDIALVILPMPVLWRLQMPVEKKVAVNAILALGLLICGLTAARINSIVSLDAMDFTYTVVPDLIFGALEIELGIVVACLPILRPVGRKVLGSNYMYSAFGRAKSSDSDRFGFVSDKKKRRAHIGAVGSDSLSDNKYALGEVVSEAPPSQAAAQAHVYSSHDLESGDRSF
ncbi:hypothetical protein VPNG_03832 [Cytospora leucostoma]|uniref:Rhodopsin domain-containing protein n=1 Tax=Cytospora leucostoma TaxID=1230097 RepID=A0A423XF07_9PEZI|nr:hypothetical protein VPNG_03832 [Cytospora leucostoma]